MSGAGYCVTGDELSAEFTGFGDEVLGGAARIKDCIVRHQQPSGERAAKVRFGFGKRLAIQHLTCDAVCGEGVTLAADLGHLLVIRRDPDRAGPVVFNGFGQAGCEVAPE